MITLRRPERTTEQLRALAASGASGLARKAQAELRERVHAEMRDELAKRQGAR